MKALRFLLLGLAVVAGLSVLVTTAAADDAVNTPEAQSADPPALVGDGLDQAPVGSIGEQPLENGWYGPAADYAFDDDMADSAWFGPSRVVLPPKFEDPAFERYVDLRLVGEAISSRDAALLTDLALQLAEGERVLLRFHRSKLTAESLLERAAKLAANRQDLSSLDRLANAADTLKHEALAVQIAGLRKLEGTSRTTDPALTFLLESGDLDVAIQLKEVIDSINAAQLIGDSDLLDEAESNIAKISGTSEEQVAALRKLVTEARNSVTTDGSEESGEALRKLFHPTRNAHQRYIGGYVNGGHAVGTHRLRFYAVIVSAHLTHASANEAHQRIAQNLNHVNQTHRLQREGHATPDYRLGDNQFLIVGFTNADNGEHVWHVQDQYGRYILRNGRSGTFNERWTNANYRLQNGSIAWLGTIAARGGVSYGFSTGRHSSPTF